LADRNQHGVGIVVSTIVMNSSPSGPSAGASFVGDTLLPLCWKAGGVVAGLVALVAGLLYAKQDSLLYFPEIGGLPRSPRQNPRGYRSPSDRGHDDFEDCRIRCDDGVEIHAWLLYYNVPTSPNFSQSLDRTRPDRKVPTIIFFHGNAGNIGFRIPNALFMLEKTGCNVLMVEYRGYGDSDSVAPTEAGLKLDARAALQFCLQHKHIDPHQIFLFGRSLGGAVAFDLARYAQEQGVVLSGIMVENTFTSIPDMVDQLMPAIAVLKSLVLRISWDSTAIVPRLRLPMLFLAGSADELVPPSQMSRLVELAGMSSESVNLHVIEGGTHNECWVQGGDAYWKSMADFVKEHAGRSGRVLAAGEASTAATSATSAKSAATATGATTTVSRTGEAEVGGEASAIPTMSKTKLVNFVDLLITPNSTASSTAENNRQAKKDT
jgi:pimeloyl-ACP methyl ester carboxylesterase